jgi:hypothetical protein
MYVGQTMLITMAYHGRSNQEHVLILEFGTKHTGCSGRHNVPQVHDKSITIEIPDGWAGWKAARYCYVAYWQYRQYT